MGSFHLRRNHLFLKSFNTNTLSAKMRFANEFFVTRAIEPAKPNQQDSKITSTKIFVGGIPLLVTESEFVEYFRKFGSIHSFIFPKAVEKRQGRELEQSKGYAFIIYDSLESTKKLLSYDKHHYLRSKIVG